MFLNRHSIGGKLLSVMLAAAMVSTVVATSAVSSVAVTDDTQTSDAAADKVTSSANNYGLKDNPQDGVILHAWQWSFQNIKSKLPEIAAAGYSTIQTSVVQQPKESTAGKTNEVWWVYYQPAGFYITTGNNALGTKSDLQELCAAASEYGIRVIVDVVANHLGNKSGYDKADTIPDDIKNDSSCWHDLWNQEINYGNRYSITHGSMGGLPDLNSESSKIQGYVTNYLKECIDVGVTGFRFDAAKHISVPDEGSEYTFWPNVLNPTTSYAQSKGFTPYYYGEALYQTTDGGGPAATSYTKYMSLTDDTTGNGIRGAVAGGNAAGAAKSSYDKGISADKVVLWAESHDTYSNGSKDSTNVSDSNINKTWAMVASRNKATALYFARTQGWCGGQIGQIYSTQCFNTEVAEVNKFHNYFAGQSEYLSSSGSIAYNERGTSGVVLVNVSGGSQQVSVAAHKMADGTYKDQVSGSTFTVSNGQISGQIGNTGIAVVYNASETPTNPPTQPPTQKPTSAPTTVETYVKGDANGDGAVNMKDCVIMQKSVVGSTTLTGKNLKAADVTGDSKVAVADIVAVMRYLVGFTNTYSIGSTVQGGVVTPTSSPTSSPTSAPTSAPVPSGTVKFDGSAIAVGNERWALYVWKSESDNKWIDMSGSGSSITGSIPDGYTNFIIVRMNGATSTNSWDNKWNQSPDLSTSSGLVVKATGWGSNGQFNVTQSN